MPVPHIFEAGEIAASSEVNENFQYFSDIIGNESTAEMMKLKGGLQVGKSIYGSASPSYTLLGWNVVETGKGSSAQMQRIDSGKPATAIRMSGDGFDILTTSATSGDLNTQLRAVFGVHATKNEDWIFIDPTWSIQRVNQRPTSIEHYRLTYVQLEEPVTLFENQRFGGAGTATYDAYKYKVPRSAKMVRLMAHVTAFTWSGSALYLMQARKTTHKKYGFVVHDASDGGGAWGRAGGQGDVPLGVGAYQGKFVVQRTAGFEQASLYLQGYWI